MITKQEIVSLMDLTQLGDNDTVADIVKLCSKARNALGQVAAICVFKEFVPIVKEQLGQNFKVATVVNFPAGDKSVEEVLLETSDALRLGADEIDLVIDYKEYLEKGVSKKSVEMVSKVKELCQDKVLKVIIESGELKSENLISLVSQDVILAGADFIKTSTGKKSQGATPEAARNILETIAKCDKNVGFKASGGIRNYEQAVEYIHLADKILSSKFVNSKNFRFGVSGLLDNLLNQEQEHMHDY